MFAPYQRRSDITALSLLRIEDHVRLYCHIIAVAMISWVHPIGFRNRLGDLFVPAIGVAPIVLSPPPGQFICPFKRT